MDASEPVNRQQEQSEHEKSPDDDKLPNSTTSAGIKPKKSGTHSTATKPTKDVSKLTSSLKPKGKDKSFVIRLRTNRVPALPGIIPRARTKSMTMSIHQARARPRPTPILNKIEWIDWRR